MVSGLKCVGTLTTLGPGHCVCVVTVQYQHFLSNGNQLILAPLEESWGTTCFGIILWRVTCNGASSNYLLSGEQKLSFNADWAWSSAANRSIGSTTGYTITEKALVGGFSVIVQLHRLTDLRHYTKQRIFIMLLLWWQPPDVCCCFLSPSDGLFRTPHNYLLFSMSLFVRSLFCQKEGYPSHGDNKQPQ